MKKQNSNEKQTGAAGGPLRITNLGQLVELATKPREVGTELDGVRVSFVIRPIPEAEVERIARFKDFEPPRAVPTMEQARAGKPGEIDYDSPEYARRAKLAGQLHAAAVIQAGMAPGSELVPAEMEVSEAWAALSVLPPRMIDFLTARIVAITSSEMELVNFTTSAS